MENTIDKRRRRRRRKTRRLMKRFIRLMIVLIPLIIIVLLATWLLGNKKQDKSKGEHVATDAPIEIQQEEPEPITASILTGGDIIMHDPFITSNYYLKEGGTYDYNDIFKYIKGHYEAADLTILNLESTISDGNYKGYPRFRAPAAIASALANNGTDICQLANNHIYDNYDVGFNMTINAVEANAMKYMGVRKSISEKTYMIQDINGIKVGFFNYVFNTGAKDGKDISINSIPVNNATAPLINTFNYGNIQKLYNEIQTGLSEMKEAGVEYTIAYIHWGVEYETVENARQQKIAQELCELGIDALIGGHPHVIQPVDLLTNTAGDHQMICAYSLGNHLSNQYRERMVTTKPTGHTEDGLMVNLMLEKAEDGTVSLVKADFIPTWVYRTPNEPDEGNPEFFIMPLDNPSKLLKNLELPELTKDVEESLQRTNEIIGAGVEKVKTALPLR